jgi:hypothetical protein
MVLLFYLPAVNRSGAELELNKGSYRSIVLTEASLVGACAPPTWPIGGADGVRSRRTDDDRAQHPAVRF